ncbi:hypothetical protein [Tepidibacillus marianensis]|uniref:hypothetical protein n=1 Tax=Tepidibacillus marianensis TaxID=3131995 RepID=UPI0030D2C9AE
MTEEKIAIIAEQLIGLKSYEWSRIKQKVDMMFSSKAAKVELDDLEQLTELLKVEFNLQRFGEKLD